MIIDVNIIMIVVPHFTTSESWGEASPLLNFRVGYRVIIPLLCHHKTLKNKIFRNSPPLYSHEVIFPKNKKLHSSPLVLLQKDFNQGNSKKISKKILEIPTIPTISYNFPINYITILHNHCLLNYLIKIKLYHQSF
jgi:hypothetical protein